MNTTNKLTRAPIQSFLFAIFLLSLAACKRDSSVEAAKKTEMVEGTVGFVGTDAHLTPSGDGNYVHLIFMLDEKTNCFFFARYSSIEELSQGCGIPTEGFPEGNPFQEALTNRFIGKQIHFKCFRDHADGNTVVYDIVGMSPDDVK